LFFQARDAVIVRKVDENETERNIMKRLLLTAMLLSGPGLQQGLGQDFKKVIDIVVDMETSL